MSSYCGNKIERFTTLISVVIMYIWWGEVLHNLIVPVHEIPYQHRAFLVFFGQ
jgi:hypothetical protein